MTQLHQFASSLEEKTEIHHNNGVDNNVEMEQPALALLSVVPAVIHPKIYI